MDQNLTQVQTERTLVACRLDYIAEKLEAREDPLFEVHRRVDDQVAEVGEDTEVVVVAVSEE